MAEVEIDGVRISIARVGRGEPTLLFIHGFSCDRYDWVNQTRAFSASHRVVTFDLPGHGQSGVPKVSSVAGLANVLREVRRRYGGEHVVLISHSMGCRVALEACGRSLEGVVGLVLVEQNLVGGDDAQRAANAARERLKAIGVHEFLLPAFGAMLRGSIAPDLRRHVLSRVRRMSKDFAAGLFVDSILWEASEAAHLSNIRVPVLLLQATYLDPQFTWHDLQPGMTTAWIDRVRRAVPSAQLRLVPAAGHFPQITAADAVNRHIAEFLESI